MKKPAQKNDPAFVRKVRSLRDAYLAEVNAGQVDLPFAGKYLVAKSHDDLTTILPATQAPKLLAA